ncbi:MAG: agmatine deiminase [Acidobacteria bacterium]|nr:agmatine deiminase [Acidobacteriota bacterium]|tara:strand:- start:12120 stop:13229 length:1110 start_codon:yes stop_codon:yes gene_type:complete
MSSSPSYKAAIDTLTPLAQGFTMPAEWQPHRATWLVWPHNQNDWPGKLVSVTWAYGELIRHLAPHETVVVVFASPEEESSALWQLRQIGVDINKIERVECSTNRSWIRDTGGTFIKKEGLQSNSSEVALVDWGFNGWGKYSDWVLDNKLPENLARVKGYRRFLPSHPQQGRPVVLEGGSIDVNGQGVGLTTEQCLLDNRVQPRNPVLGLTDLEEVLTDYLGLDNIIWLGGGIAGDDTHGHVDDVARFVGPNTVAIATETNQADINYLPLRENLERLEVAKTKAGHLTVVPIPMPQPLYFDGQRLPASYLNFYLANEVVLVPTFNDQADRVALGVFEELFPDHQVVGIHAVDLVLGLGSVHCLTLQEPQD